MNKGEKIFNRLYTRLNDKQREAVDTVEGPVMVIAGPGTGKTEILTLRAANILRKTDIGPDGILALAFTQSAVSAMRKRLVSIVGSDGFRVHIHTFHGFANNIIGNYPEYFPKIIGSRGADKIEQLEIIEEIILKGRFKLLKPFGNPLHYVKSILRAIEILKRENNTPTDMARMLKEKNGSAREDVKSKELLSIYRRYEEALRQKRLYDYGDMIMETIRVLEENEDLAVTLREEYQYILADEHQDANQAQNRIIELLSGHDQVPNLFIVGDEKQAIFQFQGASLNNFLYFKNRYPKARLIELKYNYRSTQNILDSAHDLAAKNSARLSKIKLAAENGQKGARIFIHSFSEQYYELEYAAESIHRLIEKGDAPDEIAVLYRQNDESLAVSESLARKGIPHVIESETNILDDSDIIKLITLLRACDDLSDDILLIKALHLDFLNIESGEAYELIRKAKRDGKGLWKTLRGSSLSPFLVLFSRFNSWGHNLSLPEAFVKITNESGFLSHLLSRPDSGDKLSKLSSLYDQIKILTTRKPRLRLNDFIRHLDFLENHNLPVPDYGRPLKGVRLMTAHGAKGLEFDFVFITGVVDGRWGGRRENREFYLPQREESDKEILGVDNERRLFYVAITRARKEVHISYSLKKTESGEAIPSRFLGEIEEKRVEKVIMKDFEIRHSGREGLFREPVSPANRSLKDKDYLNKLFAEQGFSVTHLNNYLSCPWRYFFLNLIQIPEVKSKYLSLGTAVHGALKDFFQSIKDGNKPGKKMLLGRFKEYLSAERMEERDYQEVLERGARALSGYFDFYKNNWPTNIINEMKIEGINYNNLHLSGRLDKVTFLGSGREVTVTDYKTGAPGTRNKILGKTKNSNGDYFRQLVFYKLLLDNYAGGRYLMTQGEIDFIQPDDKGRYRREIFEITDKEVRELAGIIERTAQEIIDLSFWNKTCSDKKCQYCALRAMMG